MSKRTEFYTLFQVVLMWFTYCSLLDSLTGSHRHLILSEQKRNLMREITTTSKTIWSYHLILESCVLLTHLRSNSARTSPCSYTERVHNDLSNFPRQGARMTSLLLPVSLFPRVSSVNLPLFLSFIVYKEVSHKLH